MPNHPNRSQRKDAPGRTPKPDEIKSARKEAGLTQTQAGELVYRSLTGWQKWEQGERRMDPAIWEYFLIKLEQVGG